VTAPDFRTLARTFRELAGGVIAQAPEAERPRVRLRLAASVLGLAHDRHAGQRADAVRLVEQACSLLRDVDIDGGKDAPPGYAEVERLWHRTAVALLEGWVDGLALETHLRHALGRFPDDPQLRLARGFASESLSPLVRPGDPDDSTYGNALGSALDRFRAAQEYEPVRAEAMLHAGAVLLRLRRPKDALEELDAAAGLAADAYVRYLVHLFRGQALDALERFDEAVEAYRLAGEAVPGAQTAAVGLTLALTQSGRHDAATGVAAAAVRNSSVPDPFLTYGTGAYRSWPALIASLQEAVR
jgi:hypothetical protein